VRSPTIDAVPCSPACYWGGGRWRPGGSGGGEEAREGCGGVEVQQGGKVRFRLRRSGGLEKREGI